MTRTINLCNSGADPGFDQGGGPDRDRPKTAILGPQFCRILVLGPHFWWSGGPPGSAPELFLNYYVYDQEFHYIISSVCWYDCFFDYNDLQFHLMGHHMKQSIDYMRAHTWSSTRRP